MFVLVVSDSGNHRIIIIDKTNNSVLHIIGGSSRGSTDGEFSTATFNNPQGVAGVGQHLVLVADTDNHLIRQIDMESKM